MDGAWYVEIAKIGYGPKPAPGTESPWPFFPFLPGLMRVGGWLGPSEAFVGVAVNHLAFLLGLAGLYRIARRHVSPRASELGVWLIALFPASFLFSMIYPSAIFLAASVWAFCFVEERRDLLRGIGDDRGRDGATERLRRRDRVGVRPALGPQAGRDRVRPVVARVRWLAALQPRQDG